MAFYKETKLKNLKVCIKIFDKPFFETETEQIFGYPINLNTEQSVLNNSHEFGNTTKGYWLKIKFDTDTVEITTDILNGYRVYYYKTNNSLFISDNYNYIINEAQLPIEKHDIEYDYWNKHSFTSGQSTFIKGLNKISPASILTIDSDSISEGSYFKDIERTPDYKLHKQHINDDLNNTFLEIKKSKKKAILLFSGGKDSCLLLQYLLKHDIKFTPVFFKLKPINRFGFSDIKRVRAISKNLNLPLDEIEIDLSIVSKEDETNIINRQLFDKHFSLLHYLGNKKIQDKYGEDCLIINGQTSDSILSFGPSENSKMSLMRRHIMYNPKSLMSKIGLALLIIKTRIPFRLPKNETENLFALFDEFKYTCVIDKRISEAYKTHFLEYIKRKTEHLKSFESKKMYVKSLSFMQGSDNQVVVNSSKQYKLQTIMPFATPGIIYNTIRFKDNNLEIKTPKYVIDYILKEDFSFFYDNLELKDINCDDLTIDNEGAAMHKVNDMFKKATNTLFN